MAKEFPLAVVIRAVDRVTAPLAAVARRLAAFDKKVSASFRRVADRLGGPALKAATGRVGDALGEVGRRAAKVAGVIGGLGAAVVGFGLLAARSLITTASEFERFRTILETVEGSAEKADESMNWVSEFAARTPFELAEVTDSFVKLRAYGIDPTRGALRAAGDTAAAMGKSVDQAVEALADAMTGENERLKEFGIRASKVGKKIVYQFDLNGKQMKAIADANNRAMIEATLTGIWNEKFGGAMDKLSGTWDGMVSNLLDQWSRFKLMIMESGVFDSLKRVLESVLDSIDRMAESGQLKKFAEEIGGAILRFVEQLPEHVLTVKGVFEDLKATFAPIIKAVSFLFGTFGPGKVILGGLAVVITAALLPAVASLVVAVATLVTTIGLTPLGWIIAGLAALAAVAVLVYRKWDEITAAFTAWWETVKGIFGSVVDFLAGVWKDATAGFKTGFLDGLRSLWDTLNPVSLIVRAFTQLLPKLKKAVQPVVTWAADFFGGLMPNWARNLFDLGAAGGGPASAAPVGAATLGAQASAARDSEFHAVVDFRNIPPGVSVATEKRGAPNLDLNLGYQGYAPGF